jgi:hypothetical protein
VGRLQARLPQGRAGYAIAWQQRAWQQRGGKVSRAQAGVRSHGLRVWQWSAGCAAVLRRRTGAGRGSCRRGVGRGSSSNGIGRTAQLSVTASGRGKPSARTLFARICLLLAGLGPGWVMHSELIALPGSLQADRGRRRSGTGHC